MGNFIKMVNLKLKFTNVLMLDGKKNKGEIIMLKFIKKLQKSNNKDFKFVIQFAIINSMPLFKISEKIIKRSKKKNFKSKILFIVNDSYRIMIALKLFKYVLLNHKHSNQLYKNVVNEILISSNCDGQTVNKKIELLKKILTNRRYLSKITLNRT